MSKYGGPVEIPKANKGGHWTATNFQSSPTGPKVPDPLGSLRKKKLRGR